MAARTFAVAGASSSDSPFSLNVGGLIAEALLKNGAKVKVLAREASAKRPKIQELAKSGAEIVVVDYSKPETFTEALRGVDVVISALSGEGMANQSPLARAAKQAGVKLFVPSEFGNPTSDEPSSSPLYGKRKFQEELKSLGLPYALVWTGPFTALLPRLVAARDGKISIPGDGKAPISWTALNDMAAYVAYVITHESYDRLNNSVHRIESDRVTFGDLAAAVKAKHPEAEIVSTPAEDSLKEWQERHNFLGYLFWAWATGKGVVGEKSQLTTSLYPGWKSSDAKSLVQ